MSLEINGKKLKTPTELAKTGVMSLPTQWRKRSEGLLGYYSIARKIYYAPEHLEAYFKLCEVNNQAEAK